MRRKIFWFVSGFFAILVIGVLTAVVVGWYELRASLPITDGTVALDGLSAAVNVERDAFGVATITAASRADAARALGFLHAQDRFFQMDLLRRQAAGELSGLVGVRALDADRGMRVHRFRAVARRALAHATREYRGVLEAYASGVNAGLAALGARPFEYLVLRAQPAAWQPEDSFLAILAMFNTLQGRQANFEATFGTMAAALPPQMYEFLTARGSEWDTPVVGDRVARPPIPGPEVFDLRGTAETGRRRRHDAPRADAGLAPCHPLIERSCLKDDEAAGLGSNNWAVAGAHTSSGAPLIANDMHLSIGVPNIWYRASMVVPDTHAAHQTVRVTGVTLPGVPGIVVGSNGRVAWGFTNTGGDWSDLVIVRPDPHDAARYLTPSGPQPLERFTETISVHRGTAQSFEGEATIWGPIVRKDARGQQLAQHWVAHDADRLAFDITSLEQSRTLDELLAAASNLGIPAQNFVAGDTSGRIGWTIAGPVPRRVGFDGSIPTSWADGARRWNGYLATNEQPRIVDPPTGRLWTANAPVVMGEALAAIGEGGYADGIRARLIRDRLMRIEQATPGDMLAVQLETSALFHERWRDVALGALTPGAMADHPQRAAFRALVENTWTGQADPDSVAYLLVRTFRAMLSRDVFAALSAPIIQFDPNFDYARAQRSEGPLWQLVTERPRHLLNPVYASWDAQIVAAIDEAIAELTAGGDTLATRSWGTFNRAIVAHPLAGALPWLGRYMNMPADALPGDVYTPRAHSPRTGPSERMVVAPGREDEGVLHMPGGQSGHPLSPHYADQHHAWVTGEPLPFLPGKAVARLTLVPRR